MDRTEKSAVVDDLRERIGRAQAVLLADYQGLTVEQVDGIRREFRQNGCEYRVAKNTLIFRAVEGTDMEKIKPLLKGTTVLALGYEEPGAPAKVLVKFAKEHKALKIKGGFLDGQLLDVRGVNDLAALPGRDEIRAQLLSLMLTPARNFLSLLTAGQQQFLLLLGARETSLKENNNA